MTEIHKLKHQCYAYIIRNGWKRYLSSKLPFTMKQNTTEPIYISVTFINVATMHFAYNFQVQSVFSFTSTKNGKESSFSPAFFIANSCYHKINVQVCNSKGKRRVCLTIFVNDRKALEKIFYFASHYQTNNHCVGCTDRIAHLKNCIQRATQIDRSIFHEERRPNDDRLKISKKHCWHENRIKYFRCSTGWDGGWMDAKPCQNSTRYYHWHHFFTVSRFFLALWFY